MKELISQTLGEMLTHLGIGFQNITITEMPKLSGQIGTTYHADIDTDEAAPLIGYHGETIYAMQHLLKTILWKKTDESVFVVVDVDSYRKRQEESVLNLAIRKVEEARKTMQDQRLPPMSSYFRRIVHLALAKEEFADIQTESEGTEDHRSVIIKIKK